MLSLGVAFLFWTSNSLNASQTQKLKKAFIKAVSSFWLDLPVPVTARISLKFLSHFNDRFQTISSGPQHQPITSHLFNSFFNLELIDHPSPFLFAINLGCEICQPNFVEMLERRVLRLVSLYWQGGWWFHWRHMASSGLISFHFSFW